MSHKDPERRAEAEVDLSAGKLCGSCGNALADCGIGLVETEAINQIVTGILQMGGLAKQRRLPGRVDCAPPSEADEAFDANTGSLAMVFGSLI